MCKQCKLTVDSPRTKRELTIILWINHWNPHFFNFQALLSFSVVIVQYLIPCAIVTICYVSICRYLGSRPLLASNARQRSIQMKRKRNNWMLIVVSITHFMSWLPLNVVNVIMTTLDSEEKPLFEGTYFWKEFNVSRTKNTSNIFSNTLFHRTLFYNTKRSTKSKYSQLLW